MWDSTGRKGKEDDKIDMDSSIEFLFQTHSINDWEEKMEKFIKSIPLDELEDTIWFKMNRTYKKIEEELIPLGYYTKFKYQGISNVKFEILNHNKPDCPEHGIDGVIKSEMGQILETVQITTSTKDYKINKSLKQLIENQKGVIPYHSFNKQVEKVIKVGRKKINSGISVNTILIGTNNNFCGKVKRDYPHIVKKLEDNFFKESIQSSNYERIVLVDYKPLGVGGFIEFEY